MLAMFVCGGALACANGMQCTLLSLALLYMATAVCLWAACTQSRKSIIINVSAVVGGGNFM